MAKIISFLLTLAVNAAAGVVVFFGMVVAMNGYHESDATYGIAAYVVLAAAVTLGMGGLAALATHLLEKRGFRAWVAVLVSAAAFSAIGIVLKLICSIIGVGIAEFVRVNY
jgi:hypothetical protein